MRGHLLCRDTFALAPRCPLIRGTTVQKIKVSWIMPDEAKKLNFFNTNWSRDAQITSWLRHQPRIHKSKQTDWFAAAKVLCQVSWLIKKLIAWILGRYIFICIDGHCVDIYGYYKTDANHDQARFSRRWFFAPDSRCKIIGFPIGWDIDLRAFLGRIIDYGTCKSQRIFHFGKKNQITWSSYDVIEFALSGNIPGFPSSHIIWSVGLLCRWALRDRSPNTEEGGPGEKWGGRAKLFGSLGGGGAGNKNCGSKGGPTKKNQDYRKYSGENLSNTPGRCLCSIWIEALSTFLLS